MNNRVRIALISLVSTVWAVNMLAPVFVKGYEPQEGVHVAFMAIVGVLTAGFDKEKDQDKDDEPTPKPRKRVAKKASP